MLGGSSTPMRSGVDVAPAASHRGVDVAPGAAWRGVATPTCRTVSGGTGSPTMATPPTLKAVGHEAVASTLRRRELAGDGARAAVVTLRA